MTWENMKDGLTKAEISVRIAGVPSFVFTQIVHFQADLSRILDKQLDPKEVGRLAQSKPSRKDAPRSLGVEDDELFEVDFILKERTNPEGKRELLIRWKGYGKSEDSWIPENNLSLPMSAYPFPGKSKSKGKK